MVIMLTVEELKKVLFEELELPREKVKIERSFVDSRKVRLEDRILRIEGRRTKLLLTYHDGYPRVEVITSGKTKGEWSEIVKDLIESLHRSYTSLSLLERLMFRSTYKLLVETLQEVLHPNHVISRAIFSPVVSKIFRSEPDIYGIRNDRKGSRYFIGWVDEKDKYSIIYDPLSGNLSPSSEWGDEFPSKVRKILSSTVRNFGLIEEQRATNPLRSNYQITVKVPLSCAYPVIDELLERLRKFLDKEFPNIDGLSDFTIKGPTVTLFFDRNYRPLCPIPAYEINVKVYGDKYPNAYIEMSISSRSSSKEREEALNLFIKLSRIIFIKEAFWY